MGCGVSSILEKAQVSQLKRYFNVAEAVRLFYKTLSLLGIPVGILTVYIALKNEHHHEEEMKEKETFIRVFPREIRVVHFVYLILIPPEATLG